LSILKTHFNLRSVKTKGLTLLIEHGPCCILSVAAGFIGLPMLAHNPVLELGFAIGGAFTGEYIGHRLFHRKSEGHKPPVSRWRRYGVALAFGLASWGIHQAVFHKDAHPHDHHEHHHHHDHKHDHKVERLDIARLHKTPVFQR
jgi:hypothetical protein